MSHPDKPEYFTLTNVDAHDGTHYLIGIFENIDAVYYRMKQMYLHCGSELHVECHHLSTAESEAIEYNEQTVNRTKYRKDEAEKEAKLKEYDEWKGQIKADSENSCFHMDKAFDELSVDLPNIKAAHKTVGIAS